MSEATEETFNLPYLYSVSPRLSLGSERDNILYGASCHAGARLCRSPGVSLALHPICRVLTMTGWPAVRMRSSRLGPHTLLTATAQPAHRTPKGPPCLVPGRSTKPSAHRHISISFSLRSIPFSSFFGALSIAPPFLTIFRLSRQAQASSMMNVFNNLFSISGGGEGWEPI